MTVPAEELVRAARALETGAVMLDHGYAEEAGRAAYMASFHAVLALLITRTNKHPKTHHGVHVEFARLTLTEPGIDASLVAALSRYYEYKTAADYGGDSEVLLDDVRTALSMSQGFVDFVKAKLTESAVP